MNNNEDININTSENTRNYNEEVEKTKDSANHEAVNNNFNYDLMKSNVNNCLIQVREMTYQNSPESVQFFTERIPSILNTLLTNNK